MERLKNKIIGKLARIIGNNFLYVFYRYKYPMPVVGITYHLISDEQIKHLSGLYTYKNLEQFKTELQRIQKHYSFISYTELASELNRPLNGTRAVILTFDDGFAECYSNIRPVLNHFNIPAVFFITTQYVNNKALAHRHKIGLCIHTMSQLPDDTGKIFIEEISSRYDIPESIAIKDWLLSLSYDDTDIIDTVCKLLRIDTNEYLQKRGVFLSEKEIVHLHRDGFTIGAHSVSHMNLRNASLPVLKREILDSCRYIQELTGQTEVPFAFPFNSVPTQYISELKKIRSEHPFVGYYFHGTNNILKSDHFVQRVGLDERNHHYIVNLIQNEIELLYRRHARNVIITTFSGAINSTHA